MDSEQLHPLIFTKVCFGNSEVVEKQMSHLVGNEVSRIYNTAEYLKERRKMLEWWSNYIDSLTVRKKN